jgi:L-amino acid N-acyltransferase YncA
MAQLIRDATIDDLPRIVEIYNLAVPTRRSVGELAPISVESRIPWFTDHDARRRPIWVLEQKEVIGWISLQSYGTLQAFERTAEVSLFIAPEAQNRGHGTLLLARMIAECPRFGVETLIGTCFGHNVPTLRLNERLGFQCWGRFPSVATLDGISADLVFMGLKIVSASSMVLPERYENSAAQGQTSCSS